MPLGTWEWTSLKYQQLSPVSLSLPLCLRLPESLSISHFLYFNLIQSSSVFLIRKFLSFNLSQFHEVSLSLTHSLTHSLSLSLSPSVSLFFTHAVSISVSLSLSLSLSISLPLFQPFFSVSHLLSSVFAHVFISPSSPPLCQPFLTPSLFMFCIPPTMLKPLEIVWSHNPKMFKIRNKG